MSLKLPVCPHCGQKVGFVKAWFLKQEGEYRCSSCGGFSNVHLDSSAPVTGSVAVLLSVVIFLLFRFITGQMPFLGILAMAVPYLLFFLVAPFLVRLKKPGVRKSLSRPRSSKGQQPRLIHGKVPLVPLRVQEEFIISDDNNQLHSVFI